MKPGVCIHCDGWGCARCNVIVPPANLGEQGPAPEELAHARELDALRASLELSDEMIEIGARILARQLHTEISEVKAAWLADARQRIADRKKAA